MASLASTEIAASAARLVVEEGMEYGPAKRRAARDLGRRGGRAAELPGNEAVEAEVRQYLELFCADTQPTELAALRRVAQLWMQRLAAFRPHLAGAVWRGTATRLNNIHIELYADDSKAAEIALLDLGIAFDIDSTPGPRGLPVDVLIAATPSLELGEPVTINLIVLDHDDLRGGLKPDAGGRSHRGDLAALERLLAAPA